MDKRYRIVVLIAITVAAVAYTTSLPPIAQVATYHNFADHRNFLGITNFLDVASNVPFLFVGLWGLFVTFNWSTTFRAVSERWPYAVFFMGVALTFAGSSYYHLHPDNARLVWDRLPMTLGFIGILSAVLAERVSLKGGLVALPLLVSAGIASVAYWHITEVRGHGDLRPYSLVQFGSLLIVLVTFLLFPSRYTQQKWFFFALAAYVIAKALETFDQAVYAELRLLSGHTLKHLAAAAAAYCIAQMLRQRSMANPADGHCQRLNCFCNSVSKSSPELLSQKCRLAPPFMEGDRRLYQARSTHCSALGEARRNTSAPTSSYQRQHGVRVSRRNRHLANCAVQSIRL